MSSNPHAFRGSEFGAADEILTGRISAASNTVAITVPLRPCQNVAGRPLRRDADRTRRAQPLGKFAGSDPVSSSVNHDLIALAIADIAAEDPGVIFPYTGMLARQTGLAF